MTQWRRRVRSSWKGLLRTAGVVLATLLLGEAMLRAYHYFEPLPIFYSNHYDRFRGKPFAPDYDFRLNSHGFKDVEYAAEKAAGAFRILALGDSFAYGVVPYAANYLTLLEDDLNRSGAGAEVINMGIPGIGPAEYLSLLVREGLALQPDMVLLSFFIGNDFEIGTGRRLLAYTYLGSFIKFAVDLYTKFPGVVAHGAGPYHDADPTFTDAAYLDIEYQRSRQYVGGDRAFETNFPAVLDQLLRMDEICRRNRIKLVVVLLPDELQVDPALQQKVAGKHGRPVQAFDFALPNRRLAAALRANGVDTLDLLPAFVAGTTRERLYKPNDTHWNIRGNALAADLIARHLARQPRFATATAR